MLSEYRRALIAARRAYEAQVRPDSLRLFYRVWLEFLEDLLDSGSRFSLGDDNRALLLRLYLERFVAVARALGSSLDTSIARAISGAVAPHAEIVGSVSGAFTSNPLLAVDPFFVNEITALRYGAGAGSSSFRTLARRGLLGTARLEGAFVSVPAHIDRLLRFSQAAGIPSDVVANRLAYVFATADPDLEALVRASGRFQRRALRSAAAKLPAAEVESALAAIRTAFYDARRIAVTELNNAFFEADRLASVASPGVDLLRWHTSGRHNGLPTTPDECTGYREANLHGYGKGLYHPASLPAHPHPHCACWTSHVFRPEEEWQDPPRSLPERVSLPSPAGLRKLLAASSAASVNGKTYTDRQIGQLLARMRLNAEAARSTASYESAVLRPRP